MSINDIVSVQVNSANAASPTRQGLGTPMLLAYFNAATHWQGTSDLIRIYPSSSVLATLVATEGFSSTGVTYRQIAAMVAQQPCPPLIALGRRQTAMTQILQLTCLTVVVGAKYYVTIIGTDGASHTYNYVSTGVPATDAAAFAALMTASNIGIVTVSGAVITITQSPGLLTDLTNWCPYLKVANMTVDPTPGVVNDLTSILAVNSGGWYSVSLDSNSASEVEHCQTFVEGTGQGGKIAFYDSADTANVTTGTGDLNSVLDGLTYNRCHLGQSNSEVLSAAGAAMACRLLAMNPGSYSAAFKTLTGVLADTDLTMTETQQLILNSSSTSTPGTGGKNGNWYKTVSGLNITFPGVAPSGKWIDQVIFDDWLQINVQADLLAYIAGLPKVPLTDFGILGAVAVIKSRLKIGASPTYGGIDGTRPMTFTYPTAASMSTADRNNRNLSGLGATFYRTGAINTTELVIVGSP